MTGVKPDWWVYRREVFGEPYMVWHDGADFTEIARRYAADPSAVLSKLAVSFSLNDDLAARAARYLEPNPQRPNVAQRTEIVAMLEAALSGASDSTRVEVAASLYALGGCAELAQHIVQVLNSSNRKFVRVDAARRLAVFAPTPELIAAVAAAVQDPEYLVRYHSANTLLRWAGRTGMISDDKRLAALLGDAGGAKGWAVVAEELAVAAQP